MFTKKILAAAAITSQPSANGVADAIDFDGTNDYLSRSSDLVGNADGKTFTFSAWVWMVSESSTKTIYNSFEGANGLIVHLLTNDTTYSVTFQAYNSVGTRILLAHTGAIAFTGFTFLHIVGSFDMANTSDRSVYINDVAQSITYTVYTNSTIDFTKSNHAFGAMAHGAGDKHKGRLSNVFLDYTYRDLSIEANRRLFITADRKPTPKATLQALNPILYLPLDDPTQAGKNLGTGGDFTLNGVVARSGRGPNQFNAVYSDLDGSTDYLSRASALVGVSNGKQLTISFDFICDSITNTPVVHMSNDSVSILVISATGNISCFSLAGSPIFNVQTGLSIVIGRNYHVAMSFDLTNTAKRFVYINGVQVSATYSNYNNIDIPLASSSSITIGRQHIAGNNIDGRLGNVFFDTKYIDLSIPSNLAKFVIGTGIDAKPVDLGANGEKPFGTPPLIYLPMYGNNAGKNYGTGGDFTVNSGPFAGARGPNEYWGNWADFGAAAGDLVRSSALAGVSDGKTFSASFYVYLTSQQAEFFSIVTSGNRRLIFGHDATNVRIYGYSSGGSVVLNWHSGAALSLNTLHHIFISIDLSNSSKRSVYIDGASVLGTWNQYSDTNIQLSANTVSFGNTYSYSEMQGKRGEFYFTTEYIDFSQEANRLKFRDAFGNPVDLRPQIAAGTLPNPAIYMRFDPANFGKNDGTGGDFVVNGTIADGGQL